jgi:hypothetical protein
MRYWWVNQNQTFRHEFQGGFLWSPKTKKNGGRNQFYENMKLVAPGDLIFSFCDTKIRAIGVATGSAASSPKPDFGSVGDQWDSDGWLVPVEFAPIAKDVRPKEFVDELVPHLSGKYDPIQTNGNGNQAVYLAEISKNFAGVLLAHADEDPAKLIDTELDQSTVEADAAEADLAGRTDIGETQKRQLISARRGQGIFRANVRLNEQRCRVTGIKDPRFLIASHIKPWSKSTDAEKLDGRNGLLLAPHVDRLFDRGFISFTNEGTMIVADDCPDEVLTAWGLDVPFTSTPFSEKQKEYLEFHRTKQFRSSK